MGLDLPDYVTQLGQEKFRAIIIHTLPKQSPALSQFGRQIHQRLGGGYLDLLAYFQLHPELAAEIDRFSPEKLKMLLQEQSKNERLLVVDRLDFLLDTWRKSEQQAFYRLVNRQWNSFVSGMNAILIFCLQTSDELLAQSITDAGGQSRVHHLTDFNNLG